MSWFVMTVMVTLALSVSGNQRNEYTLRQNKYGDVLIAISEDVPEDLNLIQKIKDGFTSASADLFVATRRRAYLGNVTILVPYSWTRRPEWQIATTESFERANVIIDHQNPLAGYNPYVNQPGQCGEPGKFMHLTPKYLTDRRLARQWGPTGKTILHEFGHLRWGFFDEYPIPEQGYKRFYHSTAPDGTAIVEPVRCSKRMYGENKHEVTGNDCKMNPLTSLPEDECSFFPPRNRRLSPAKGSLMFWHFMTYADSFCDNDPADDLTLHNDEAPNKHNRLCGGRSQWEIMRDHVDFKDGNNPVIDSSVQVDTTPDFTVVQRGKPRIVLIMDVSGSMGINNRLLKANQAASEYLRDAVETGTMVGIVTFSSYANITHDLIEIVDDATRQQLIDSLPTNADGSTAIGQGILKGIEILENHGDPRGGKLLLLSDGIEIVPPLIAEVKPTVLDMGVIVDTIRYTDKADTQLLSLAANTGGLSFFSSDKDSATALGDALTKTVTSRPQKSTFVKVFGDTITLPAATNYSVHIFMDEEIGSNSEFVIKWLKSEQPKFTVSLFSPGGSAAAVRSFDASKEMRVSIDGIADSGKWLLYIQNPSDVEYNLQVSVTSRAKSPTVKPITLTSELSSNNVDFNDPSSTRLIIYATLSGGYTPVVEAEVYAVIDSSTKSYTQRLFDNGAGADTTKDDGVYSGYFLQMDGDGEYSVKVKVNDQSGNAKKKTGEVAGQQRAVNVGYLDGNETDVITVVYVPITAISRVTSGGFFKVANQPSSGVDLFSPSTITDLEVVEAIHETATVTLRWTAVGNDLDQGQATKYDLRMSSNILDIRQKFDGSPAVSQSQLVSGDLSNPKPAGQVETFTIQLDKTKTGASYAFAVKAIDSDNKVGGISNIVPVAFTTKAPERYVGVDAPNALSTGAIVAVAIATTAVVVTLIVSIACYMSIKKKSGKVDSVTNGASWAEKGEHMAS